MTIFYIYIVRGIYIFMDSKGRRGAKMIAVKRVVCMVAIAVSLLVASVCFASALEYWANGHYVTLTKLENESHFVPSYKTTSTSYGVVKGMYIRQAYVYIKEGNSVSQKYSAEHNNTYTESVWVSTSQVNNPFTDQTWVHRWYY
jgi:hypothetical protein